MNRHHTALAALAVLVSLLSTGCATSGYDYTAFRASKPRSILILPPVNNTTDVGASNSLISTMSLPLGEAGYYVYPVTLVDETFRQNGLNNPAEIATVSTAKLRQIFGADAALYVQISQFGKGFVLLNNNVVVTADAKLVDLRNGTVLWQGNASADSSEVSGAHVGGGGSPVGILVALVVSQVIDQATDTAHRVATLTSARLLSPTPKSPFAPSSGLLYGPRSPQYER